MENTLRAGIIVVSDTVYEGSKQDVSGEVAREILSSRGYRVVDKIVVPNRYREILRAINELSGKTDFIIAIGGTGPSPRDITVDVVESIAWRKIPGFGEIFRLRSYEEIGMRGAISRAELFILANGTLVAVTPGSTAAVKLALSLLLEIIDHLVEESRRYEGQHRIYVEK